MFLLSVREKRSLDIISTVVSYIMSADFLMVLSILWDLGEQKPNSLSSVHIRFHSSNKLTGKLARQIINHHQVKVSNLSSNTGFKSRHRIIVAEMKLLSF